MQNGRTFSDHHSCRINAGPPALPLVGSLPFVRAEVGTFATLAKEFIDKYGKVMGMYVGHKSIVAIYDFQVDRQRLRESVGN